MFTPPPPLHLSPRVSRLAPKPHPPSSFPSPQIGSAAAAKRLTLRSSDGEDFEVEEAVALESRTIRHMLEDECSAGNIIPLPNVTANILSRVIEYCKKHVQARGADAGAAQGELQAFDSDFVKVDQATLFDLILAASYLGMKGLQDLTCQTVADMIKGKTPEEVCNTFNIKNDFTRDQEEEEVRLAFE